VISILGYFCRIGNIGRHIRSTASKNLFSKLNKRLTLINQKSPAQNAGTSAMLFFGLVLLGVLYFLFAHYSFNGLWYHKVLCIFSTIIFVYLCKESYFEIYERQIKKDLPNTLKKLTHYYNHYGGNIMPALDDTISGCPKGNRIYIQKIKDALLKPDYERQIEELEHRMPTIWFKMLCRLILFAKENGGAAAEDSGRAFGEDVIFNNLKRLTNIVILLNFEQEYNDAELLGMQFFVFFAPFLAIPMSKWYNTSLLLDLDMRNIYGSIEAQGLTAVILAASGLGAVFIHWMRKLQN